MGQIDFFCSIKSQQPKLQHDIVNTLFSLHKVIYSPDVVLDNMVRQRRTEKGVQCGLPNPGVTNTGNGFPYRVGIVSRWMRLVEL
ncbi:hypothetical protein CTI12_AA012970 [Artemisia annua]|uniref:Uncharacterized protein n=1 Tax=Artemisia annua TaxID=35608 RepID=A0A2U1QLZ8_ARTAN|nr:hypothetical protein CTI12_AA012970 [Artemisia annua]